MVLEVLERERCTGELVGFHSSAAVTITQQSSWGCRRWYRGCSSVGINGIALLLAVGFCLNCLLAPGCRG